MPEGIPISWKDIEVEMSSAHEWRAQGKEGRARVCARRAAGWAISLHKQSVGTGVPEENAYQALLWLRDSGHADDRLREAAGRLCTRVTDAFEYPHQEDALQDAEQIIARMQS
jgi:hypothetical protein